MGTMAGVLGPSGFVVVFLVEGWLRPGYHPLADYVSALSLGERGWIQIANFLFVGTCLVVLAGAAAATIRKSAGPIMLGIVGIGYLMSGPFVMDPAGTPRAAMSTHGLVHGVLGAVVFVLMPIIPFVFLRRFRRDTAWRSLSRPTVILGTITAATDIAFTIVTKSPDLMTMSAPWTGLLQRLVIVPFQAWVVVLALGLRRIDDR